MKLSQVMIAVAALSTANAFAVTDYLAGASASAVNVVLALKTACTANAGTFLLSKNDATTKALGNVWNATCSTSFDGASLTEVRANNAGGSASAVSNNAAVTGATALKFLAPTSCSALGAGTEVLSFLAAGEMQTCASAQNTDSQLANGGFMDQPGNVFPSSAYGAADASPYVLGTDYKPSSFFQSFGVAVSNKLYQALQKKQGLWDGATTTAGANNKVVPDSTHTCAPSILPLDASGNVVTDASGNALTFGNATPACQPSLTKADVASLFSASTTALAKKNGANYLVGTNAPALSKTVYCRRPSSSGTQASVGLYFLSNPTAKGDNNGFLSVAGGDTLATGVQLTVKNGTTTVYQAYVNNGTSDVKNCLNNTVAGLDSSYSIGVVSLENNPIPSTLAANSDSYRFVKLNTVAASEGVFLAGQTASSIAGNYDFTYESYKFCPGGTCSATLNVVDSTNLAAGSSSPGLYLKSETTFTHGATPTAPLQSK